MKWFTKVDLPLSNEKITYSDKIIFLGSCFSNEIGKKISDLKFQSISNPLGISFNPISIFKTIEPPCLDSGYFAKHDGLYFHHDFHSELFNENLDSLKEQINLSHNSYLGSIQSCDWLVITMGSSIVHELVSTQSIVANNHKQPKNSFNKRTLSIEEIVSGFEKFYSKLPSKTKVIINVSPIRHTREGLPENQLSKSILRVACDKIESLYDNVDYLPTYEIIVDELRDYRFYKDDLIHPSKEAVDYIFEQFTNSYFSPNTKQAMNEVEKLLTDLNHKPLFPQSNGHQKFISNLISKLEKSPHDFENEILILQQQIT